MTRVKAGPGKDAAQARRRLFVSAYLANGRNAAAAAVACGMSEKGADIAAWRLLKHPWVKEEIERATEKLLAKTNITAERVLEEIGRIAFADPRTLYRPDGSLKQPHEWDDDTAAFVSTIEVAEEYEDVGRGEDKRRELSGYTKKVKAWDKLAGLSMAAKHLGLFEKDNAQKAPNLALQIVTVGPE